MRNFSGGGIKSSKPGGGSENEDDDAGFGNCFLIWFFCWRGLKEFVMGIWGMGFEEIWLVSPDAEMGGFDLS